MLSSCSQYKKFMGLDSTKMPRETLIVGAGQSNMEFERLSDTFRNSVNIAHNGTLIAYWQRGTPLYTRMMNEVKNNHNSVVVFWQGEGEGISQTYIPWAQEFTKMVRCLREDVGFEVPIVYVQIGQIASVIYPSTPYWTTVQEEQASVRLPNTIMISAADMFPGGDAIHYSQVQYRVMQGRMQEAIAKLSLGQ